YRLAPYSPEACFVAAALDVKRGRFDESMPKSRQALLLGQKPDSVLALYLKESDRPDLAMQLVDGDMYGMLRLADRLEKDPRHATEAAATRQRAMILVKQRAAQPDAPAEVLALMAKSAMADKDFSAAASWYSRAIGSESADLDW